MWVKLDDHFVDHPKVLQVGPLAGWLFVAGLCYANRLLTDGFIPANQVTRLVTRNGNGNVTGLVHKLCEAGLWSSVTVKGAKGFLIHDFLKYQPSKKKVMRERKQAAQRQEKWRQAKT